MSESLEGLRLRLREFAAARDWEQFHIPRNLTLALAGEVGELAAEFQWMTESEAANLRVGDEKTSAIADEMADILIYLVRLADVMNIGLVDAAMAKVERNESRFPPSSSSSR